MSRPEITAPILPDTGSTLTPARETATPGEVCWVVMLCLLLGTGPLPCALPGPRFVNT